MNVSLINKPERPVRFIQFGGGVFLRGFFDRMLAKANEAGVIDADAVIIRTRTSGEDPLASQNFMYTHVARDADHTDITKVDCIAGSINAIERFNDFLALGEKSEADTIVSNTTESGIVYTRCPMDAPETFPALLCALLYRRYTVGLGGCLILPCELIEANGDTLREIVLHHAADWNLPDGFANYVTNDCSFRNTLVDSIISGKPGENFDLTLPYEDKLINTGEYFHLWVIDGTEDARLPFLKSGANIKWVNDITAYRTLKVRILNGAHTSMIPYALLCGVETVGECMKDERTRRHLEACLFNEILPSMDFDPAEARAYADDVIRRFENPYIRHLCRNIALNSIDKFRVRVLPSILAYREKFAKNPVQLTFALAMLLKLYREGEPNDTPQKIASMQRPIPEVLADTSVWGCDLTFLYDDVINHIEVK